MSIRGASLVALSGPLDGSTIPLPVGEFSVGCEEGNLLVLDDRAVSRRHCTIYAAGTGLRLRDLGSSNRTKVNGLPVDECALAHGDEIRIGRSRFLLLAERQPRLAQPAYSMDSQEIDAGHTVVLQRSEALYLEPGKLVEGSGRAAANLKILLQVSNAVASAPTVESLVETLLESAGEVVPADRGVVLLANAEGQFSAAGRWQRQGRRDDPLVSKSVVRRVAGGLVSVCLNRIQFAAANDQAESVIRSSINAIIAVPVVARDELAGVLYFDSSRKDVEFDQDHLQLLTGIAGAIAVPLANMVRLENLESEKRRLESQLRGEFQMVGDAPAIREVYGLIRKVAPSTATVLISGESGTGKELVARAIHHNSPRARGPFVAINCAAITDTLLESELFGHEKGSFTGAMARKKGKFEEASGGTIFLDEIGELAPRLQAKLLRVLQERQFERVGGTQPIKVDVRVVAATNRDLQEEVRQGRFRQDLYYRLNVVSLRTPPLRERREDIPTLVQYFLEKHAGLAARRILGLSGGARTCLMAYDWPGNVRELENAVERAIVLGSTEEILTDDLPDEIAESPAAPAGPEGAVKFHETIREVKRQLVSKAFEQSKGDHGEAARQLGIHPNNLHRLLKTLGLKT